MSCRPISLLSVPARFLPTCFLAVLTLCFAANGGLSSLDLLPLGVQQWTLFLRYDFNLRFTANSVNHCMSTCRRPLTLWTDWPFGIPQYLLHLIEDLHNGSTSSVRIGSTLSASFTSTSYLLTYLLTYLPQVPDRTVFLHPLCSVVQSIGSWNVLPPQSASLWAMFISQI